MTFGKVAALAALMTMVAGQAVAAAPTAASRLSISSAFKAPAGARASAKRKGESKVIQGAALVLVIVAGAAGIAGAVAAADGGNSSSS
jgi:hypothetical protein